MIVAVVRLFRVDPTQWCDTVAEGTDERVADG